MAAMERRAAVVLIKGLCQPPAVIPAKAGIQSGGAAGRQTLGSSLRWNDPLMGASRSPHPKLIPTPFPCPYTPPPLTSLRRRSRRVMIGGGGGVRAVRRFSGGHPVLDARRRPGGDVRGRNPGEVRPNRPDGVHDRGVEGGRSAPYPLRLLKTVRYRPVFQHRVRAACPANEFSQLRSAVRAARADRLISPAPGSPARRFSAYGVR